MEITKKEIKLIIDTFEHHESNLESEWSVELGSDEKDFLNKLKEAINYTHSCTELCDCAMPEPIDPFAEVDKDTCRKCNCLIE